MSRLDRFETLTAARRFWVISSVHGDLGRLAAIHDVIEQRFEHGDRLVYLGNLLGYGQQVIDVMDEVLEDNNDLITVVNVSAPGVKVSAAEQALRVADSTQTTSSWNITLTNTALI